MLSHRLLPVSSLSTSTSTSTAILHASRIPSHRLTYQTRGFRWGQRGFFPESSCDRDGERRKRALKLLLSRDLEWYRHFRKHPTYKKIMYSDWHGKDSKLGPTWQDLVKFAQQLDRDFGKTVKSVEEAFQDMFEKAPTSKPTPTALGKHQLRTTGLESDLEIDPITNRRIPRRTSDGATESSERPASIPVKTFKGEGSRTNDNTPSTTQRSEVVQDKRSSRPSSNVLRDSAEYTGHKNEGHKDQASVSRENGTPRERFASQDQIALDRMQKRLAERAAKLASYEYGSGSRNPFKGDRVDSQDLKTSRSLEYPLGSDKREDIDLLRASDIRAASSLLSKASESETEKRSRRQKLEDEFQKVQEAEIPISKNATSARNVQEMGKSGSKPNIEDESLSRQAETLAENGRESLVPGQVSPSKLTGNFVRDFPEDFKRTWTNSDASDSLTLKSDVNKDLNSKTVGNLRSRYDAVFANNIQRAEREVLKSTCC